MNLKSDQGFLAKARSSLRLVLVLAPLSFMMANVSAADGAASTASAAPVPAASSASAPDAATEQTQVGAYVARAADCAACHTAPKGEPYAGGYAINSPLGVIYASNITPSKQYGIGNWTEEQFAHALRDGVGGNGQRLYPAMPYDAYHGMSDADVHALYTYLMQDVKPVDRPAKETTALSFPFNIRQLMIGWDWLYVKQPRTNAADSAERKRGRYLVDVLGHCASCHSPRNVMMATTSAGYLSGADLAGWHAPNITSDPVSGIGGWSTAELVTYLRDGHVVGKAQAAGPMAEAVENSFRYLTNDDLVAIASYLKSVPPIRSGGQEKASDTFAGSVASIGSVATGAFRTSADDVDGASARKTQADAQQGALQEREAVATRNDLAGVKNGALLYENTCATCHQSNGGGTKDQYYPSLFHNTATGGNTANNVVMTILKGVRRHGNDTDVSMPAFEADLNDEQVAAITNYVMARFGNPAVQTSENDVKVLRSGGPSPLIQRVMPWVYVGVVAFGLIVVAIVFIGVRRRKRVRR